MVNFHHPSGKKDFDYIARAIGTLYQKHPNPSAPTLHFAARARGVWVGTPHILRRGDGIPPVVTCVRKKWRAAATTSKLPSLTVQ